LYDGYVVDFEKMCRRIIDLKIEPLYTSLGWNYKWPENKVTKIKSSSQQKLI